jgi:RimJ/RimL family protein N-acetyltransferase
MKYLIPESLETSRLVLRQFCEKDNDSYSQLMQNSGVVRFLDNGNTLNTFESWHHLSMLLGHWVFKGFGCYAIEEKLSRKFIGKVGLYSPHQWPGIELTWLIDPHFQNKGFAFEAAQLVINSSFKNKLCNELISIIHPENLNSIKLAQKLGMTLLDSQKITDNPSLFYQIKQADWEK